jgi:cardiolipin synthase (CMP-forming)
MAHRPETPLPPAPLEDGRRAAPMPRAPLLRHLPNLLSLARLAASPALLALALAGRRQAFAWLLFAALATDAADGRIARRFGLVSRTGALLDSVADALLLLAIACGVALLFPDDLVRHRLLVGLCLGLILLHYVASLARYGRPASFHTHLARALAVAFAGFLAVLFLHGWVDRLFYLVVALCLADLAEEFVLLWLLPTWTPDVGGLARVLRRRRARPAAADPSRG